MKWKIVAMSVVVLLLLAVPASLIIGAAPENGITSPSEGDSVLGEVSIEGTASAPDFWKYELHYNPVPGNAALWTALPGSPFTAAVVEGELAVWDTTTVADGTYGLLLRVVKKDGARVAFDYRELDRNQPAQRTTCTNCRIRPGFGPCPRCSRPSTRWSGSTSRSSWPP
jgi:hypothetical protein